MKILFAIPHFYKPRPEGLYGSERESPQDRGKALAAMIACLHQTFGVKQALSGGPRPCNDALTSGIEIIVCTTGDSHLVPPADDELFRHRPTTAEPPLLGYECHAVLAENLGRFDYYCYAEDDILITDPLLFMKLAWFCDTFGEQALLMPHRFELAVRRPIQKLYIDGPLHRTIDNRWPKDLPIGQRLSAKVLGTEITFERTDNPHSGCFFLNARQMETWSRAPYFLDRSRDFVSPMVSAANLGPMKTFDIYKPALAHAGFLEVRHFGQRYIGMRLAKLGPDFELRPRAMS